MKNDNATEPHILTLRDVSRVTGLKPSTLRNARWRRAAGLRVTKLGGRIIGVAVEDLAAALRREHHNGDDAA